MGVMINGPSSNLSPQQFSHEQLGHLRTPDFGGTVGAPDPVGRMQHWQNLFGGTTEARHYDDGDHPAAAVERLRESIKTEGVREPLSVTHWHHESDSSRDYMSIQDGHHRAVAAHLEGQGAPVLLKHVHLNY